jgi:hypothetical protein
MMSMPLRAVQPALYLGLQSTRACGWRQQDAVGKVGCNPVDLKLIVLYHYQTLVFLAGRQVTLGQGEIDSASSQI